MWAYNYNCSYDDHLMHSGKAGMKWGYNNNKRNGKRVAGEVLDDVQEILKVGTTEVSRAFDNEKYKTAIKVAGVVRKAEHKKDQLRYEADKNYVDYPKLEYSIREVASGAKYVSKVLNNNILLSLNKISNGTLDNKVAKQVKDAKKFVKDFFGN